ncbi:LamG domain-containing protein [Runella salmonicolor]|uniref:LamG domain-containing protein n=1 Tax=Runella salmonicolor TaxID=2950278 RepID=A0ABT1FTT0_9BACT|nr:LamG domain-containing protein [Runella salmonicolor]MCP1385176.1 LamG domain-containing protein [Runella salmonicolor]
MWYRVVLCILCCAVKQTFAQNIRQGIIACYSFDGNAKDGIGNNDGLVRGATLTEDRYGKANSAYSFNGIDNYIEIKGDNFKNTTYTLALWAYPIKNPAGNQYHYAISIGGAGGDQSIDISNGAFNAIGWTIGTYLVSPTPLTTFCAAGVLPELNKWYHIVATRDNQKIRLYVDGAFICESSTQGLLPNYGTNTVMTIGRRAQGGQFLAAKIDDVVIYNRVLSDAEVVGLYNQLPCGVQPSLSQSTITEPGYFYMEGNSYTATRTPTSDKRTFLQLRNNSLDPSSWVGISLSAGSNTNPTVLEHFAREYSNPSVPSPFAGFGQLYSRDNGLILRTGSPSSPNGVIKFMTGNLGDFSLERMRIDANGNLGVGTQNPKSKLQITSGDVYVENPDRGIILKSPNGSCWRVTIDDLGNFVRTSIPCP